MNILLQAERNQALDYARDLPKPVRDYIRSLEKELNTLQAKIDGMVSAEGWRQSAEWAERSGGTL